MTDDLRFTSVPTVTAGMGIRRPPGEVFQAFVDSATTTRFWIADSSGRLALGSTVRWDMQAAGASAEVVVKEIDLDRRIAVEWGVGDVFTTVEFQFVAWGDDGTHVEITETGFTGTGDELAARVADSTGRFTMVLCSLKALLEHDITLNAVADRSPTL